MRITTFILYGLFLIACNTAKAEQWDAQQSAAWSTDVIGIDEMRLSVNYWVKQIENAGHILKNQAEIAEFKRAIYGMENHMVDLALFPVHLSGREVKERIQAISKPNKSELFSPSGELLGAPGYEPYTPNPIVLNEGIDLRRPDV